MRTLLAAWRETSTGVRRMCVGLWCAGVVLLVVGIAGDLHSWWDHRGFLSNLASSATSGLFGVPFALVVIQHISVRQANDRERREVRHLAASVARGLAADARQLLRTPVQPAAVTALRDARTALQAGTLPVEAPLLVRQAYERWAETVSPPVNSQVLLDRLAAGWRSLKEDVRPRVVLTGGRWLDRDLVDLLDEALTEVMSGVGDMTWMNDVRHAASDIGLDAAKLRREAPAHLRRLERAEAYLRGVERIGRYADDIRRQFVAPVDPAGASPAPRPRQGGARADEVPRH